MTDRITALEEALQDLQTRYAFQEDMINSLNQIVVEQAKQLSHLELRIQNLRSLCESANTAQDPWQPQNEPPPPHY